MKRLSLLLFVMWTSIVHSEDVRPFIGNFHGTGMEIAVPFIRDIDNDGDGVADLLALRYIVYPVGSAVPVFTGSQSVFPYPKLTCSVPVVVDYFDEYDRRSKASLDSSLIFHAPSKRLHTALNLYAYCPSTQQVAVSSAIHSARLDGSSVNPDGKWKRYFPGWEIYGLNGVDTNGDNLSDVLAAAILKKGATGAIVTQFLMLNPENGAVSAPVKTYFVYQP